MNWDQWILEEQQKQYYQELQKFVEAERLKYNVYPPKEEVLQAFKWCKLEEIKVVILGQDPYHGLGQANGLAFSVNDGVKFPPSLRNIFIEVEKNTNESLPISGNLDRWAKQGVLLLNDVLTVRGKEPGSHQRMGWEKFTDAIIDRLSTEKEHLVFMLWGNFAQKKGKRIDGSKHLILTSGHPSPMSANQGKWFGNLHFKKANEYLLKYKKKTINW